MSVCNNLSHGYISVQPGLSPQGDLASTMVASQDRHHHLATTPHARRKEQDDPHQSDLSYISLWCPQVISTQLKLDVMQRRVQSLCDRMRLVCEPSSILSHALVPIINFKLSQDSHFPVLKVGKDPMSRERWPTTNGRLLPFSIA